MIISNKSIPTLENNTHVEINDGTSIVFEFDILDELIKFLTELAYKKDYVFRGYSQQKEMLPKLIRDRDLTRIEIDLLKEFEKYGSQYINLNDQIDLLSYAQHFGLSTRLLDFTYNPFIALYFAFYKSKPNNATIKDDNDFYYIRFCKLEKQILFSCLPYFNLNAWGKYETSSNSRTCEETFNLLNKVIKYLTESTDNTHEYDKYFEEVYASFNKTNSFYEDVPEDRFIEDTKYKFKEKRLLFIDANQSNQRLVMQQGLYLFPYILEKYRLTELINDNTQIIKIHKNLRKDLLIYLNTIGINAFRLMPDISSICEAVERKIRGI